MYYFLYLISDFVPYIYIKRGPLESYDSVSHTVATATTLTQCCVKVRKWHHSYLPVFLKDGLVSLLEHALQ